MRQMRRSPRRRRGQAATELALSMLLIVPIFLYALFLEDLLRHSLMLQEAVLSTPWDLHGADFETKTVDPDGPVANNARLMWCDHTSAYNSYDNGFECDETEHHKAVSAHVCWIVEEDGEGQNQIHCSMSSDVGTGWTDPLGTIDPIKSFNKGGQLSCTAYAGVINYFLPQKIFSQFTDVETTDRKMVGGDVHSHYGMSAADVYRLKRQHFSVLHDPWAMSTVAGVSGSSGGGPLQQRVNGIYSSTPGMLAAGMGGIFFLKGVQQEVINPLFAPVTDTPGSDNLLEANVSYSTSPGGQIDNHYASPWKDWANDPVEGTYNNRGKYFMGATAEPN